MHQTLINATGKVIELDNGQLVQPGQVYATPIEEEEVKSTKKKTTSKADAK